MSLKANAIGADRYTDVFVRPFSLDVDNSINYMLHAHSRNAMYVTICDCPHVPAIYQARADGPTLGLQ